jgi:hypothetical protein
MLRLLHITLRIAQYIHPDTNTERVLRRREALSPVHIDIRLSLLRTCHVRTPVDAAWHSGFHHMFLRLGSQVHG